MKRDAGLHITKSSLREVLGQIIKVPHPSQLTDIVEKIFELAQPYQIKNRYTVVAGSKGGMKKQLKRSMEADSDIPDGIVERFHRMLVSVRMEASAHTKVRNIQKGDPDYVMLKEVAKLAYKFSQHFELPIDTGLKQYAAIGLKLMGKYALNKYKYYDKHIYELLESIQEVEKDENSTGTAEFHTHYLSVLLEYSGMDEPLNNDYTKYVHMVYGRRAADAHEAPYEDWVRAQFEGLTFVKALPNPNQFYGDGAVKRYERYLKMDSNTGSSTDEDDTDLRNIYKGDDDWYKNAKEI